MAAPLPSQRGRTIVITGASSGIGQAAARSLARLDAHVVLACRDHGRGEAARQQIAAEGGSAELAIVDVADQASVRSFATALCARHPRIDVLVDNAGIWSPRRRPSPDGIELTWATNVLGYTLVTDLLREPLARARGRIVVVASRLAGGLDLTDVEFRARRYDGLSAYRQSKQANRMWTRALARRLAGDGVTANVLHPGGVATGIFAKAGGVLGMAASALAVTFGKAPEKGADTAVWLATAPELAAVTGRFFVERRQVACEFVDREQEEALFALCQRMTGR